MVLVIFILVPEYLFVFKFVPVIWISPYIVHILRIENQCDPRITMTNFNIDKQGPKGIFFIYSRDKNQ